MNETTYNTCVRVGAFLLFLVLACSGAWAQVTEDMYTSTYGTTSISSISITHKSPKWTQYHKEQGYNDTYNESDMITLENGTAQVQAANAYVDTIYMHKGTSITLTLPYRVADSNASIYNYLRWFDYRTDGNYNCNLTVSGVTGTVNDLLTPAYTIDGVDIYRFANGYVEQGGIVHSSSVEAMTSMNFYYPTDGEFTSISSSSSTFNKGDNDYYIVACDVSIYTDFAAGENDGSAATFGSDNSWCEPTLSGRAIYYIIGVEDDENHRPNSFTNYWKLLEEEFQGGIDEYGNEVEGKEFIDEYEITYPSRRLSNNTAEMVALTKDACAYAIPGTDPDDDPGYLDVTLIDGLDGTEEQNPGFRLTFSQALASKDDVTDGTRDIIPDSYGKKGKISGNDRIIFFYKGTLGGVTSTTAMTTVPTDTQWYVDDGSTITILVTKTITDATSEETTTYNLARYKITFKDDANLLTQTQVAGLGTVKAADGTTPYWWEDMTQRSPDYMEETYTQVASLTFDYDTSVNASTTLPESSAGQAPFYPFPMDWTSNGYAFYDGATKDVNTTLDGWGSSDTGGTLSVGTRFSMYSITNDYIGYWDSPTRSGYAAPPTNLVKDDSGYWLYIDASERPGAVAEITIDGNLCAGSKLYGTAWIKGAGGNNSVDAGVLFSIGGVTQNDDGTETHQPILRQATGQVRATTRITSDDVNEPELSSEVTGKGAGTNQWFQVYFSFVTSGEPYDYYTLRVDNYCAGTDGGDYYFDELKVYVETPTVEVEQLDPICTEVDARSFTRFDLDYETLLSRLGYDESDYANDEESTASVDLVIINRARYYNGLAAGEEAEDAFRAALVTFYDANENAHQLPTLDFYLNYGQNLEYNTDEPDSNLVSFDNEDEGFFYRRLNGTIRELSMDCHTDMVAYTDYILLAEPHTETDKSTDQKIDEFIDLLGDECCIISYIFLTSTMSLQINGQLSEALQEYCAGQLLHIAPELTYTLYEDEEDTEGTEHYAKGIYFDWFFGTQDEYVAEYETTDGATITLQRALTNFRCFYPDAEELDEKHTPPTSDDYAEFTQNEYDLIEYYLNANRTDGGEGTRLVLHEMYLDVRMLVTGIELVVQPIKAEIIGDDGEPINTDEICFGYSPFTLMASGEAPTLMAGFSNINYPNADFEPCLRLGLAQLEKNGEETPFIVNLRDATYTSENVAYLGIAGEDGLDKLFLIDSDDPYYQDMINDPEFDVYSLPVGKIQRLWATEDNDDDTNGDAPKDENGNGIGSYMQIYFYSKDSDEDAGDYYVQFAAREGYYYALEVYFEEYSEDGESVVNACQGIFPLEVKVVPEYLVWTGEKDDNWNNDDHWERVSAARINRDTDTSSPYFTDGNNTNTNGYVPMLFTKVIMPRDSEAELYMAGFMLNETGDSLDWVGDEEKEGRTPTTDHEDVDELPSPLTIMYDMMLYETVSGNTSSFKTEHYRVNLCDQIHFEPGAQLLHAEQLIYNKAWTDVELAQGPWTLASTPLRDVVSGDWYTKSATGTETAEYFTDITFSSTDNDRYNPMVYQRNWSNEDNQIIYNSGNDKDVPAYVSTGWSSVYNDVTIPHQPGEGFSIKASRTINSTTGTADNTDSLMFRFPKADESYSYQGATGTTTATSITRTNAGQLRMSAIVDRTEPDKDDDKVYQQDTIHVVLAQTENDYYIIGNPFTAHMSMSEFLTANTQFDAYWLESTYGPVVGTGDNNSWGTDEVLVEPYSAFFVSTASTAQPTASDGVDVTVVFTKGMQTVKEEADDGEGNSGSPVRRQTSFAIRAEGEGGTTSASIAYAEKATDNYRAGEDAVLMEDASWKREGMPLVYSVAEDKAVSVNTLKQLTLIPIGAFADEGSLYTLSFVGVDMLDNPVLIDTYEDTETPITEGFTMEVEGSTHGRYFIRTMSTVATDIEETASPVLEVSAYSPVSRTVVVSSDAGLENVEIYSVGGMLLKRANVGGSLSCTINGVASGIAIVKVKTTEGTSVKKIRVR